MPERMTRTPIGVNRRQDSLQIAPVLISAGMLLILFWATRQGLVVLARNNPTLLGTFLGIGAIAFANVVRYSMWRPFSLQLIHWIFVLTFFFIAPIAQYGTGELPWSMNTQLDERLPATNVLVLAWCIVWTVFAQPAHIPEEQREAQPWALGVDWRRFKGTRVFLLCAALAFLAQQFGQRGLNGLFLRGAASDEASYTASSIDLLVNYAGRALPLGLLLLAVSRSRAQGRSLRNPTVYGAALVVLITNFPLATARFWSALVAIGVLGTLGLLRRRWTLTVAVVLGLGILMPVLGAARHATDLSEFTTALTSSENSQAWLTPDFDAYSVLTWTHEYVRDFGVTNGSQLLTALLFFVPRTLWPTKSVGSGYYVAHQLNLPFDNISNTLPAEGVINFGLIGVVLFAAVSALACARIDNLYWTGRSRRTLTLIYPFLLGAFFFILRGDMLSSMSYTVGLVVPLLVVFALAGARREFSAQTASTDAGSSGGGARRAARSPETTSVGPSGHERRLALIQGHSIRSTSGVEGPLRKTVAGPPRAASDAAPATTVLRNDSPAPSMSLLPRSGSSRFAEGHSPAATRAVRPHHVSAEHEGPEAELLPAPYAGPSRRTTEARNSVTGAPGVARLPHTSQVGQHEPVLVPDDVASPNPVRGLDDLESGAEAEIGAQPAAAGRLQRLIGSVRGPLSYAGFMGIAQVLSTIFFALLARRQGPSVTGSFVSMYSVAALVATVVDFGEATNAVRILAATNGRFGRRYVRYAGARLVLVAALTLLGLGIGTFAPFVGYAIALGTMMSAQTFFIAAVRIRTGPARLALCFILEKCVTLAVFFAIPARAMSTYTPALYICCGLFVSVLMCMAYWPMRQVLRNARPSRAAWFGGRHMGIATIINRIQLMDVVAISTFASKTTAGTYGAVNRWGAPFNLYSQSVAQYMLPQYAEAESHDTARPLLRRTNLLLAPAALVLIVMSLVSPIIVDVVLGPEFKHSAFALSVLCFGYIAAMYASSYYVFVQARHLDRHAVRIYLISTAAQFAILYPAVHFMGAAGASLAFLVGQTLLMIGCRRLVARHTAGERTAMTTQRPVPEPEVSGQ